MSASITTEKLSIDSYKAVKESYYKTTTLRGVGYGSTKGEAIQAAKEDWNDEKRNYDR